MLKDQETKSVASLYEQMIQEAQLTPHVDGGGNVHLPPGKYFIGDPCYVVKGEHWDEVGNSNGWFEQSPLGSWTKSDGSKGHVVGLSTKHGDGSYSDNLGNEYSVDSGLLGAVAVNDLDGDHDRIDNHDLGKIVDFPKGLLVYAGSDGEVIFAGANSESKESLTIYTADEEPEDEDEDSDVYGSAVEDETDDEYEDEEDR